jgi:hypothetical protein
MVFRGVWLAFWHLILALKSTDWIKGVGVKQHLLCDHLPSIVLSICEIDPPPVSQFEWNAVLCSPSPRHYSSGWALASWKIHFHSSLFFIFPPHPFTLRSRDSSVGIATGYGLDDRGESSSPGRVKNFHFSISSRLALGSTQPPIKWVPGVKRQEREADHSPPTSAEIKKVWIYTSTPLYVFMAYCLISLLYPFTLIYRDHHIHPSTISTWVFLSYLLYICHVSWYPWQ